MVEKFDVLDKFGNKTGKIKIHGEKLEDGEYMAISHICLFSNDQMLIQKRASFKLDYPSVFDLTAGGGVNSGENTFDAALRELKEELGISLSIDNYPLMRIYYPKGIDDYYFAIVNKDEIDVHIDNHEVIDYKWATKDEILKMMKQKEFVEYNDGFIEFLFSQAMHRGTYKK